jgi:hypothetical protein
MPGQHGRVTLEPLEAVSRSRMRSIDASLRSQRPIAPGGGRLAAFLAGSAALGSLIIAVLVVLADLEDEPEEGFDFEEEPE